MIRSGGAKITYRLWWNADHVDLDHFPELIDQKHIERLGPVPVLALNRAILQEGSVVRALYLLHTMGLRRGSRRRSRRDGHRGWDRGRPARITRLVLSNCQDVGVVGETRMILTRETSLATLRREGGAFANVACTPCEPGDGDKRLVVEGESCVL